MKLGKEDKELLLSWGYSEQDFPQIEEALRTDKTTYDLDGNRISRKKAVELLGMRDFLSGLARSAFHCSSSSLTASGQELGFNSRRLFEPGKKRKKEDSPDKIGTATDEETIKMYPYITLADETKIFHSYLMDPYGAKTVEVLFKRCVERVSCSARCSLPSYEWKFNEGFSEEEIDFFNEFLHHNAHLIYRYAEQGGIHFVLFI